MSDQNTSSDHFRANAVRDIANPDCIQPEAAVTHLDRQRRASFAPDFSLSWHGSVALLRPNNRKAGRWLVETAPADTQFWSSALAIEPRHVQNVVDAANAAGFVVD